MNRVEFVLAGPAPLELSIWRGRWVGIEFV